LHTAVTSQPAWLLFSVHPCLWGAAAGHLREILATKNYSPGNAGVVLWTDILLPVIGFYFLYFYHSQFAAARLQGIEKTQNKPLKSPSSEPEISKVGSTDAPGG
jgi:hypothetical protein